METKFRAFQLDSAGSLFSYYKSNQYTLIEARLPKGGVEVLRSDLKIHNKERIDVLHITSWDDDHCDMESLTQIMNQFRPDRIEIPGYDPKSDTGKACKRVIMKYDDIHQQYVNNVTIYDEQTINGLSSGASWGLSNIVYKSLFNVENCNNMSQIRLFRSVGFNVLSLGDCECTDITNRLMRSGSILKAEVDVLILPHHGSENSMLTPEFLDFCKPTLTICSSNYDNEYSHPRPKIIQMLANKNVKNITTKNGDVIIYKKANEDVKVVDLISNNTKVKDNYIFKSKRQNK